MQSKKDKAQYDMEYQRTHMKRVTLWFNIEKSNIVTQYYI